MTFLQARNEDKPAVLVHMLRTTVKPHEQTVVFAATKHHVEYLRTVGLTPRVIASSNHLGNNDMRNLASAKTASSAKLRVKHDIFAPWQEDELDHKVSIMFTELINDDKNIIGQTVHGFVFSNKFMNTF